jgi:uncharacterized membrane protein
MEEHDQMADELRGLKLEDIDKWALGVGGLALVSMALRGGFFLRALAFGAGAGMLYRATTGESPLQLLGQLKNLELPFGSDGDTIVIERSITIGKPRDEIYRFFRNFENLPRFMRHLESVQVHNGRSHWRAKAPGGMRVEWDAEILEERPGDLLRWRSLPGSDVSSFGSVRFEDAPITSAPGGRGTQVTVHLEYVPPPSSIGTVLARLLGEDPELEVEHDLEELKDILEQGRASA